MLVVKCLLLLTFAVAVEAFRRTLYIPLTKRSGVNEKQLIWHCKHGIGRQSRNTKVKATHSYFTGCPFRLSFTLRKDGFWHLANANFTHERHAKCCKKNFDLYPENTRPKPEVVRVLREVTQNAHFRPSVLQKIAQSAGNNITIS